MAAEPVPDPPDEPTGPAADTAASGTPPPPAPPAPPVPPVEEPSLDTAPMPVHPRSGRNLPVAIVSGLVLAAAFLGTLLTSDWAFLAFIYVVVAVGLWELSIAFRERGLRPATPVVLVAAAVMLFGSYVAGPGAQTLGLAGTLVAALAWTLLDRSRGQVVASLGATMLMTVWVAFGASFMGLLLGRPDGIWYVMATVALTVTADIGAYAWGSQFGRHKLAPSVSPAKSWEGLAGGLVTVWVFGALVTAQVVPGLDVPGALAVGTGIVLVATLGDLAESLFKRDLGIKDLGRVVPGHGGIMDRVDALILTLPAVHVLLLALGL